MAARAADGRSCRCTGSRCLRSSRCRSRPPRSGTRAARSTTCRSSLPTRSGSDRAARWPSDPPHGRPSRRPRRRFAPPARSITRLSTTRGRAAQSARRPVSVELRTGLRLGRDPRDSNRRRRRPRDVRPRRRLGDLRRLAVAAPLPGRACRDRALSGQPGHLGAGRTAAARPAHRHHGAVTPRRGDAVLARSARRGGGRDRARGRAGGDRDGVGRGDGVVRRVRPGHGDRPADRARAPEGRTARGRGAQSRRDRARRRLGRDA